MNYHNIPINLIIGFLGVGKTTAIRHLLSQVPDGESWGVLVNEFGEIGIDGALLEAEGVAIQEVAGGCLCCVASAGLQVGLNQLIKNHNPDRILIEPTGLGHPAQIIDQLLVGSFQHVLALGGTIGLVDARQLSNPRYREHPTYQDQIFLADALIASKADLYSEEDRQAFEQLARTLEPPKQFLATVEHGKLQKAWLDFPRSENRQALFPEAHQFLQQTQAEEHHHEHDHGHNHKPQDDWLRIENAGDGYYSCGWLIKQNQVFNKKRIIELLEHFDADRIKGTLHTEEGWLALNLTAGEREIREITPKADNRLEIIHSAMLDWQAFDRELKHLIH